jgi:uncharacterized protein (TIGR02594 family)
MGVLKLGDQGIKVRELQALLNAKLVPNPRLSPDGDFGPRTESAVIAFQTSKGLPRDGVVGRATWTALGVRLTITPAPADSPDRKDWMPIAAAEEDIAEIALPGQHNLRIIEYHKTTSLKATDDETPWCSSFVNWVMIQAGYRGTNSAAAKSWLQWGKALTSPQRGAITVIKKKGATSDASTGSTSGFHVGFYVASSATHISLLGGNQGNAVTVNPFSLAKWELKGYRSPA